MFKYVSLNSSLEHASLTAAQLYLHALWLRRKASPPPEAVDSISDDVASRFTLADSDGDGQLTKQEFQSDLQ
jgi:hypothetical protein